MIQYKYVDRNTGSDLDVSVGLLSSMPKSLVIENCDSVHIFQGTLDLKFNLPADLEQFDTLIINGVTFERKKPEQESKYVKGVIYD